MEFTELDRELSRIFNLQEESVFILRPKKYGNQLEFIYPDDLNGLTMPLMNQSILGKTVRQKSPSILNDFQGETDVIYLNSIIMEGTQSSIRKMIAFPICLARQICAVLLVTRKDPDGSSFQDFVEEDLPKIRLAVDKMIYLQLVKSA